MPDSSRYDLFDAKKRDQKVNNLLQRLRKEGKIVADGKTRFAAADKLCDPTKSRPSTR
jgi:hypothetical protein